jgi:hypothetical protein
VKNTINKKQTTIASIALTMAIILALGIVIGSFSHPYTVTVYQKVPYIGEVNVVLRHSDGTVFYNYTGHNVLTTIGSKFIVWQMAAPSATNMSVYMSLSTDASPLVSWTKLPNELTADGLNRTDALTPTIGSCTTTNGPSWYYVVSAVWTASGTQAGIVAMGLNWIVTDDSGGNLAAAAAIPDASVISGDTVTGSYNVTVPCG